MAASAGGETPGLFAALRTTAATIVATARSRVELAGSELETERIRLVRSLLYGISALFCLGLAIVLLVALIVALNWDARIVVLGGFALVFFVASIALFLSLKRQNHRRQVFAATIAELEEDLRQLRAAVNAQRPAD